MYQTTEGSQSHTSAITSVVAINLESKVTANIISMFRNVFPSIKNYVQEVVIEFKSHDETDFNFQKSSANFDKAEHTLADINFVKFGTTPLQTPEGFIGRYNQYIDWLNTDGIGFINGATEVLDAYYRDLSIFISTKDGKTSSKDKSHMYAVMEKNLDSVKKGLASFFDSKTSNALRPAESLFDRTSDIKQVIKNTRELNKLRGNLKNRDIIELTGRISDLLNLLVDSSENDKIPEISGPAASSLAQGAMVAAHYVEFVGVLRYRIEEAIAAVGIMATQVVNHDKLIKD